MAKLRQRATPDEKIKYLVRDNKGEFVIEVPASWKLTFASVNPTSNGMGGRDGHCLRVYEGEKLRAVYAGAHGFRDLSIPLARKVSKETGSAEWTMDSDGSFEKHTKVDREEHLVLEEGGDDGSPF